MTPTAAMVRVPATSANLGPGFDAFGLSLGLYDDLQAVRSKGGELSVTVSGEGAAEIPRDEHNLVVVAMRATFDALQVPQPGLDLVAANHIPYGRGLGSSAAAIVAGVRLAQALTPETSLPDKAVLSLAAGIEGHPDNVAACLLGGFTIAWTDETGVRATRIEVDLGLRALLLVPPRALSTTLARGVLPATVPHGDAAANAGRAGLLVAAMSGQAALLHAATEDRLHQSYRRTTTPETFELVATLRSRGLAAVVSGAGPTVLVLCQDGGQAGVRDVVPPQWQVLEPPLDTDGCRWSTLP